MLIEGNTNFLVKKTTYKVVLPFYMYAALSFLTATIFLFFFSSSFVQHYFHPHILAITHIMALGWGTMIILGASHQLVPVFIEGKLYSIKLAYFSFVLAAVGIPLLVYGFYSYNMGWPAKWGGRIIFLAIFSYLVNLSMSFIKSRKVNVHACFILTAACWLFITITFGLVLVYNHSISILSLKSLEYIPLHAHTGIIGWFLLLITGVGSRLIPMFLISKYTNTMLLWIIYAMINGSLLTFIIFFWYSIEIVFYIIPVLSILSSLILFAYYCYCSFKQRVRKQLDEQMKVSLLSVIMMLLPLILLLALIWMMILDTFDSQLFLAYGFIIFFGWITAIIFGMTFKTLPFIVWLKVYHMLVGRVRPPSPRVLFNSNVYNVMGIFYLTGFALFIIGLFMKSIYFLKPGSLFLIVAALLYNWNVIKVLLHKPVIS